MAASPHSPVCEEKPFLEFGVWEDKMLWELGTGVNWPALTRLFDESRLDGLRISDAASEKLVANVRDKFDRCMDACGRGILSTLVGCLGGDEVVLLRRLLGVGLNPDAFDAELRRPSHVAASFGRVESSEALILCRANPSARTLKGLCPADVSPADECLLTEENTGELSETSEFRNENHSTAVRLWKKAAKHPPPTLSQLAYQHEWWAVQNLCRRKVVNVLELRSRFKGRNAVEWAEAYGKSDLAREMCYLLDWDSEKDDVSDGTALSAEEINLKEVAHILQQQMDELRVESESLKSALTDKEVQIRSQLQSIQNQLDNTQNRGQNTMSPVPRSPDSSSCGPVDDPVALAVHAMLDELKNYVACGRKLDLLSDLVELAKKYRP